MSNSSHENAEVTFSVCLDCLQWESYINGLAAWQTETYATDWCCTSIKLATEKKSKKKRPTVCSHVVFEAGFL